MLARVEDPEFCLRDDRNLQAQLCVVMDNIRLDCIQTKLGNLNDEKARRKLREIRDPSVSHDWLWALNPVHGISLNKEEFALGIRLRIGVPFFDGIIECAYCGNDSLDPFGSHCFCCALAAGTRGHYAVRNEVVGLAHLADPAACIETINLILNFPLLRPAGVLFGYPWLAGGIGRWYWFA